MVGIRECLCVHLFVLVRMHTAGMLASARYDPAE